VAAALTAAEPLDEARDRRGRFDPATQQLSLRDTADMTAAKAFGFYFTSHVMSSRGIARATAKIGMANLVYNINALSSCARSPSHDRLVLSKATHSTHYRSG
jgi:hypothetical protein